MSNTERLAKQAVRSAKEFLGGEMGLAFFYQLPTRAAVDGRLPDSATNERRVKSPYPELFDPIPTHAAPAKLLPAAARSAPWSTTDASLDAAS